MKDSLQGQSKGKGGLKPSEAKAFPWYEGDCIQHKATVLMPEQTAQKRDH